jgi:hypothetical protein
MKSTEADYWTKDQLIEEDIEQTVIKFGKEILKSDPRMTVTHPFHL